MPQFQNQSYSTREWFTKGFGIVDEATQTQNCFFFPSSITRGHQLELAGGNTIMVASDNRQKDARLKSDAQNINRLMCE